MDGDFTDLNGKEAGRGKNKGDNESLEKFW